DLGGQPVAGQAPDPLARHRRAHQDRPEAPGDGGRSAVGKRDADEDERKHEHPSANSTKEPRPAPPEAPLTGPDNSKQTGEKAGGRSGGRRRRGLDGAPGQYDRLPARTDRASGSVALPGRGRGGAARWGVVARQGRDAGQRWQRVVERSRRGDRGGPLV